MEDGHALPPGSLPAAAAAEQLPPHQAARGASASPPPANRQDKVGCVCCEACREVCLVAGLPAAAGGPRGCSRRAS